MKIDTHAHYMSREYHERMAAVPGMVLKPDHFGTAYERGGVRVVSCNEAWLDPDHCIRDMDKRGIDMRLLSLSTPNLYIFPASQQAEIAKRVNDETVAAVRRRPDRLRALPSLPLGDIHASLAELDRVANVKEVSGLAIGSNVDGVPLSDPRFEPVWKRINELRLPVVEHPMHPPFGSQMNDHDLSLILGFWFDTQLMVTRLIQNGIFERYPDFPFLVAHTGSGLFTALNRLDRSSARSPDITPQNITKPFSTYAKNLYYDTCSFFAPALMEAHSIVGADHLMFGTDYPFVDAGPGHVEALEIGAGEKAKIAGDNAARVFKLN
jgi:aminocarboxymuconate-semialdehyde decarboxylase